VITEASLPLPAVTLVQAKAPVNQGDGENPALAAGFPPLQDSEIPRGVDWTKPLAAFVLVSGIHLAWSYGQTASRAGRAERLRLPPIHS
jgi:hypothetical protein